MLKDAIYDALQEWVLYTSNAEMHRGNLGNRVKELQFWEKIIPSISFYNLEEVEYALDYDSVYVQLKLMYASFILVIDDIVDNSTAMVNVELMDRLISISSERNESQYPMITKAIGLIQTVLDQAYQIFDVNHDLLFESLYVFVMGVNEEILIINNILNGNTVTFSERVEAVGLQGSVVSVFLDSDRLQKKYHGLNHLTMEYLKYSVGSYLAIINSSKTVESEITQGEITSPHFILACNIEDVLPIEKQHDLIWYQSIADTNKFKQALEALQLDLIKNIQRNFAANQLDLPRFFTALGVLDQGS